jgi:hypothetical protein
LISRFTFSGAVALKLVGTDKMLDFDSVVQDLNPDVAFVFDNRIFADLFHLKNFFIMPNIDFSLDITGSWELIIQRMCRTKRKMMRQIEKLGYECEITKESEKLKIFYYDMYKPHLEEKYGKWAGAASFDVAKRIVDSHGLLLIKHKGNYVSGAIYSVVSNSLFVPLLSFRESNDVASHSAGLALLHFLILLGKGKGCSRIDYEGVFPIPSFKYGLFSYKKTYGMDLSFDKDWSTNIVAMRLNNFDKGVIDFLTDFPFVFEDGELKGLAIVDSEVNLKSTYDVPGLSSLICLCSKNDSGYLEEQCGSPVSFENALHPGLRSLLKLAMQKNYVAFELDFKNNTRLHKRALLLS